MPGYPARQSINGDEMKFEDKRGAYVKCLPHQSPGMLKKGIFDTFRKAVGEYDQGSQTFSTGNADFEGLYQPDPNDPTNPQKKRRPLNGPQGLFARHLAGVDSETFGRDVVPAAPKLESEEYATELVELYWASLLRDVPFTGYKSNQIAKEAADDLTNISKKYKSYYGPVDANENITPELLFRGGNSKRLAAKFGDETGAFEWFCGETVGPYVSQFALLPTSFGALPVEQKFKIFPAGYKNDYLVDFDKWYAVQNGANEGTSNFEKDGQGNFKTRYLTDGRGLATYTHEDELYQAYFIAYLVLKNLVLKGTTQAVANPGVPYSGYRAQQPFGTFGGADIAATLAAVAKVALNVVWYQKWTVHVRHRPESGGGIAHMIKENRANPKNAPFKFDPPLKLHELIFEDSKVLEKSREQYGSYLLSQAFAEGSPAHPAYPTGHGAVAGACITVLKFFFDGSKKLRDLDLLGNRTLTLPCIPSSDGSKLDPYNGPGVDEMTINGELHKLAHNISLGHGLHAGIHWRSDTDTSIVLGEAVALSFLSQQIDTYRERPFDVTITRIDGRKHTFSRP